MSLGKRIPREKAVEVAQEFLKEIGAQEFPQAEICGSIRRGRADVGDIDIAIAMKVGQDPILNGRLLRLFGFLKGNSAIGSKSGVFKEVPIQVIAVRPCSFGAAMLHATGTGKFNMIMRHMAKERGWILNQYGLFTRTGSDQASETFVCDCSEELPIFMALGMHYHAPIQREK